VWDHQRRHANTCNGGFSFSVEELFDRGSVSGWFTLLPYADGRTRYQVHRDEPMSIPAPSPPPSLSLASAPLVPLVSPHNDDDNDDGDRASVGAGAGVVTSGGGFIRTASQRGDNDDDSMEPPSNLKRSNSLTSLQSVAAADVVSADVVEGEVCLEISTADRFSAKPTITIKVIGAQHLVMKEP
jgi:hypothetical protein